MEKVKNENVVVLNSVCYMVINIKDTSNNFYLYSLCIMYIRRFSKRTNQRYIVSSPLKAKGTVDFAKAPR